MASIEESRETESCASSTFDRSAINQVLSSALASNATTPATAMRDHQSLRNVPSSSFEETSNNKKKQHDNANADADNIILKLRKEVEQYKKELTKIKVKESRSYNNNNNNDMLPKK